MDYMENVKCCTSAAFNGSYVALSQHLLSFFIDRIQFDAQCLTCTQKLRQRDFECGVWR